MFASLDTYQSENDSINKEELPIALASCDVDSTSSEIHRMLGEADTSWLIKEGNIRKSSAFTVLLWWGRKPTGLIFIYFFIGKAYPYHHFLTT